MPYQRTSQLVVAAFAWIALSALPVAAEGMGIQQASALCNGERNATTDQIIEGCTRVIQYGGAAFGGVKYAYVNRGYAYRSKGQCELALADFDKAIGMRANKPHVYRARGSVYLCLKRYNEALADLNYAIEKDPSDAWAFLYRGRAHLALGDRTNAKSDFDQAVKLDPDLARQVPPDLAG